MLHGPEEQAEADDLVIVRARAITAPRERERIIPAVDREAVKFSTGPESLKLVRRSQGTPQDPPIQEQLSGQRELHGVVIKLRDEGMLARHRRDGPTHKFKQA